MLPVVYVGLIDVAQSPTGTAEWRSIGGPTFAMAGTTPLARTHNDQHCIVVNPKNPNDILLGNDGGIYRMNQAVDPPSITGINGNLGIMQCYKIDADSRGQAVILGTQDNGTSITPIDANVLGGDGASCVIDPVDPLKQVACLPQLQVRATSNGWQSSRSITPPDVDSEHCAFIAPLALDPGDRDILYGADNRLYRWDFAANTVLQHLGGRILSRDRWVQCIAVSTCDSNRIYTGSADGELWKSENRGATWSRIDAGLPERAITSIVVPPGKPDTVLVGFSGFGEDHLWQCEDAGEGAPNWESVSGNGATALPDMPLNAVAINPADPYRHWFVALDVGVYVTRDGGETWSNATQPLGLPNVLVMDLKAVDGTLFAATYGRGVWRIDLPVYRYTITDLGVLGGGRQSFALGLNNAGVVVGHSSTEGDSDSHAFRWTPAQPNGTVGAMIDLGVPTNASGSHAAAINSSGDYVGQASAQNDIYAFKNMQRLPGLGVYTNAHDINASGAIVGFAELSQPGPARAVRWPGPVDLHPDVSMGGSTSVASSINDAGVIAGLATDVNGVYHGFIYPGANGAVKHLGPGGATGINNYGYVVGRSGDLGLGTATMWRNEKPIPLGSLRPGGLASSTAVNGLGEVIGFSFEDPKGAATPFVWRQYVMRDLVDLIDTNRWFIADVNDINDAGQICGWGFHYVDGNNSNVHAFLLTPVRE